MQLSSKDLMHIPVRTQSDVFLGYVIGFEMDTLQHLVQNYYVKKGVFTTPFLHNVGSADYSIHRSQVLSITPERILVEDAVVKDEALQKAENTAPLPSGEESA